MVSTLLIFYPLCTYILIAFGPIFVNRIATLLLKVWGRKIAVRIIIGIV